MRKDLAHRIVRLEKVAARVREGEGAEAVHDLRVAARRLEAVLKLWGPLFAPRACRRARRRLRAVRRAFGPVRELELHGALLVSLGSDVTPIIAGEATGLARRFARARARRLGALVDRIRVGRVRSLMRLLERSQRGMKRRARAWGDPLPALRPYLKKAEAGVVTGLEAGARHGDGECLHRLRLQVKKARYALEALGAGLGVRLPLERLHDLQRVLGEIHDRETLMQDLGVRAARLEAQGRDPGAFPALLARLETEREERMEALRRMASSGGLAAIGVDAAIDGAVIDEDQPPLSPRERAG